MQYRCCFLNEDDQVVRIEELDGYDESAVRREAMFLWAKTGFSGYELWRDGEKVEEYRPVTPGGAADPRSDELDAKLTELAPADELAYRYFYQQRSVHCRRDPLWKARIVELEGQLDAEGRARALTLAADLTGMLTRKP
jgi:hypothetical protein